MPPRSAPLAAASCRPRDDRASRLRDEARRPQRGSMPPMPSLFNTRLEWRLRTYIDAVKGAHTHTSPKTSSPVASGVLRTAHSLDKLTPSSLMNRTVAESDPLDERLACAATVRPGCLCPESSSWRAHVHLRATAHGNGSTPSLSAKSSAICRIVCQRTPG
jgi:hypothetical protein